MGELAVKLVETNEVETKALSIVDQAKDLKVIDTESYTAAGSLWKAIKDMMKEVSDTFDPIITAAHASHKKALEQKAKFYAPLEKAYKDVKRLMSDYDLEQERIRKAEEARLAEIARKAEEERQLQEAIAAEEEARRNGATKEEAAQVAQEIIEEPVYVPPVVVPKATPKLAGGPVYRTVWKHQVDDLMTLVKSVASGRTPIQSLQANDVFLGQQARSLGASMNIPGVRSYSERV